MVAVEVGLEADIWVFLTWPAVEARGLVMPSSPCFSLLLPTQFLSLLALSRVYQTPWWWLDLGI
jgi:hypothetical protein